jgi:predicted NBD/HSP70 family sugar kinase
MSLAIGLDLGGTKMEAGVFSFDPFREIARVRLPTERERGYDAVLRRAAETIDAAARAAEVDLSRVPVGVGMPGGVRRKDGFVKNSNTTCLNGRPFRQDLEALLGRPIAFDNDANCFALAEARLGAARDKGPVVFGVILGTGVGGGLVLFDRVWSGEHGIAGEWGHHGSFGDRPCYCGLRGCLETYASGPAVEADYKMRSGKDLPLAEIARSDDPHARAAIEAFLDAFGRGLANVIDVLDPSAIVLGGGVSNLELLYDEGRARVARHVFNDELTVPILRHALGDSAGVIGAALLAV